MYIVTATIKDRCYCLMEPYDRQISVLLISEDETFSRSLVNIIMQLKEKAFSAYNASSLREALGHIHRNSPDIIIMDFADSDAEMSFGAIRHANPDIPIVILADGENDQYVISAMKDGAADVLLRNKMEAGYLAKSIRYSIERSRRSGFIRRLLFTFEQISASVVIADKNGEIEFANDRFIEMTGLNKGCSLRNERSIPEGPDSGILITKIRECLETGSAWSGEEQNTCKNGETGWECVSIYPLKNSEGAVTHYAGVSQEITAYKREEDALRKSEERFRTVINNINEYIYSVAYKNNEAVSTYHSPKCLEITGYTVEEFGANPNLWFSMIHYSDRDKVASFIEDVLKRKTHGTIEHRIVNRNGETRWVSNTCAVQLDNNGALTYLHGFVLDITGRKRDEAQLRKFFQTVEQSPSSVIITDTSGKIEYVNPKFSVLTGYSRNEVIGQNPRILKSGRHNIDFYQDLWTTILAGRQWQGEIQNRKKNSDLYWEFASIAPLKNANGDITHFIGVKHDITEKKIAEEALRRSEETLRKRNEIIERDLKLAQLIQKAFLPRVIKRFENLEIEYRYYPLEKIGGDFFSIKQLGRDHVSVLIGDVVGHGVSAALFLSLVNSATQRISKKHGQYPEKYLSELNKILFEEMPSYFITAIYGIFRFDQDNGTVAFTFSNGGHPYPILYRADSNSLCQLNRSSTIIGSFENVVYEKTEIMLSKGDRLFMMTDGIIEVENEQKEIIGFDEKLLDLFRRCYREKLNETLDAVIAGVDMFRGGNPVDDDIVLMGFEVL